MCTPLEPALRAITSGGTIAMMPEQEIVTKEKQ